MQEELKKTNLEVKVKEEKLRNLNSALTTTEAKQMIAEVKGEMIKLEAKFDALSNQGNMIDQETMNKVKVKQVEVVKEWRKRKRMFGNIADAILDGYPHPKKHFFEEVGVETDQDVKAEMPEI